MHLGCCRVEVEMVDVTLAPWTPGSTYPWADFRPGLRHYFIGKTEVTEEAMRAHFKEAHPQVPLQ
jgi:hypothetical protein